MWNEAQFPTWAVGEETKYKLFQSWKKEPFKVLGQDAVGSPIHQFHPMAEFENWPYWLILELARHIFWNDPFEGLMLEPEQLKEAICDVCEEKFTNNEKQTFQQAL